MSLPRSGDCVKVSEKSMSNGAARRLLRAVAQAVLGLIVVVAGTVVLPGSAAASDAIPGGKLFAGGHFTQAGQTVATSIAAWNGVDWSALSGPNGEGADETVDAMTMYNGKLIAAGSFMEAGGVVVSGIASWNGTTWEPLVGSSGAIGVVVRPLGFVTSLAVYNGDLYVGGSFPRAGGVTVNNIARWNGSDWFALPGPAGVGTEYGGAVSAPVWDLTAVNGQLIVAGLFTTAGGVPANSVAAWNGSTWSSVDQPIQGATVLAVENYNGALVASRAYSENNFSVNDVAVRSNGQWSALGGQPGGRLNGDVRDFTVYNGLLVAGGQFTHVGGVVVNNVAVWNGSTWSALSGPSGVGTDDGVFAVTPHAGFLVVGGFFDNAGGQPASKIARWNGSAWSALPGGGVNDNVFSLLST
ncbi:hypothetical protein [Micromonospora sp. KC723]|uniref:hypothetical protein n=1 Tax=Micromonospora sp. KC723 TaxID=2530381 RepID=UPI001047BBC2|nr:hypothetical protein [Micromonospora sp. KC723]